MVYRKAELADAAEAERMFRARGIEYVEVNYLPDNPGAKENWNALGYRCFREQARKRI